MEKTASLGLPFFYRLALPGGIATLLAMPVLIRAFDTLGIRRDDQGFALVVCALLFGVIVSALDAPIYEVLEGRTLWPDWLYRLRTRRWEGHVRSLDDRQSQLDRGDWRYLETWDELRRFPLGADEKRHATRPTRLGNLLASYEEYSDRMYGMHAEPFWPRLWLTLDKDVREEIDRSWAPTDGLTYVAATLLFAGVIYPVLAVVSAVFASVGIPLFFFSANERVLAAFAGPLLALGALIPYQISLAGHMVNGHTMKSMFDVFRGRLADVRVPAEANEKKRGRDLGTWFTYGVPPSDQADDSE